MRSTILFSGALLGLLSCTAEETPTTPSTGTPLTAPEFAVASNTWLTRANLPSDRWNLATAVVPNASGQSILYAIGGATSGILRTVQAYNVATNSWTTKASLPVPLYWTNGAGVINGKIYISGGLASSKNYRAETYMYNPATNTWTRKRSMPNTTFGGVTGVINGKLYVVTRCDQADCALFQPVAFYRYNPATDQWTTLPKPASTHDWGMGGVIGGKFYVTGGTRQLEVYDPATNHWTTKAPIPLARWLGAGTAIGGKLYIIGGFQRNLDGSTTPGVRTNNAYNPTTNTWTTKAPLPAARSQIAASPVVFGGQPGIEVVGGTRPGNNLLYIP